MLNQSSNPEDPIPLLTSVVLSNLTSKILVASPKLSPQVEESLPKLYTHISKLASSPDAGIQDIAVQEYSALLRSSTSRRIFWKQRRETLNPLIDTLRTAAGAARDTDSTVYGSGASIRSTTEVGAAGGVSLQLLYHVLLVVWQLSFESKLLGRALNE